MWDFIVQIPFLLKVTIIIIIPNTPTSGALIKSNNIKQEHSNIKLNIYPILSKSRNYNMYTSDFIHNSTKGNMKLRIMIDKPVTIEQIKSPIIVHGCA